MAATNIWGNYILEYQKRSRRRVIISRQKLEAGMICWVYYKRKNKQGYFKPAKPYLVLILNSRFGFPKKTHCLRLDHIKPFFFNKLVELVGLTDLKEISDIKRVNLDKLLMYDKGAQRFYLRHLKPNMKIRYDGSYRTFFFDQIQRAYIIQYVHQTLLT